LPSWDEFYDNQAPLIKPARRELEYLSRQAPGKVPSEKLTVVESENAKDPARKVLIEGPLELPK
jgi:hypothetical protein